MNSPMFTFVFALAVLCSTAASPQRVYADDTAVASEQPPWIIHQHQFMEGRFEQWRNLAGIPRPIRSSGRFIYWRNHGLYWETQEPISQASTFTLDTIIHWQPTTHSRQANRTSSPVQKQISRILLEVFGGDIQSLEKLFDSRWNPKPEPSAKLWTVGLTPKTATIKRVVEKITLSGENYISSLNLDASNGDTTRIHFTNIRAFAHPATDDCQYFDLDSALCPGDKATSPPSNRMNP